MNYTITGGKTLSGSISIQGAKNSAMRNLFSPLLANGIYTISNVPRITSIDNLIKVIEIQGCHVEWLDSHTLRIDSTGVTDFVEIPPDVFFHTSAAIYLNTLATARFGHCEIETLGRSDTGGDQIGRIRSDINSPFFQITGVSVEQIGTKIIYKHESSDPFVVDVKGSFGLTVGAVYMAMHKQGISTIHSPSLAVEVMDHIVMLQEMGASIKYGDNILTVEGNKPLHTVDYANMYDKHDFITLLVGGLITESEIEIQNVDYDKLKLDCLQPVLDEMGAKVEFDRAQNICYVRKNRIADLRPVNIIAKDYPMFITEWQVLFSPLLALIKGESTVIEAYHFDRMQHWHELAKLGAKFEFFTSPDYPEENGKPRAVKITGVEKLVGAEVISRDVRAGGAMILAGLAAEGTTKVIDADNHILRAYENLTGGLKSLGAGI